MMTSTVNDGKKFQMGHKGSREKNKNGKQAAGWFSKITVLISNKRCLKKMQFKTHPWNGEKCKRLPKGRLRNRENVECIEMYIGMYRTKKTELYMYNSKKMELYMYNSKKTELYMYNPKKMELYMYNSKKMELHILIHSYTSHLFRRFWGRGF